MVEKTQKKTRELKRLIIIIIIIKNGQCRLPDMLILGGGIELRKHERQDLDHRTRDHSTVLCGTNSSAKEGRTNGPGIHRRLCQSSEEIARKLCPIQ